jgi:hypothetical protein
MQEIYAYAEHTRSNIMLRLSIRVVTVLHRHRGGRTGNINAWYLNTHMVYL